MRPIDLKLSGILPKRPQRESPGPKKRSGGKGAFDETETIGR